MDEQVENIYKLIELGKGEEAGIVVYSYLLSDKIDLPDKVKSYLRHNPPTLYKANGFDYTISENWFAEFQRELPFPCDATDGTLHITVGHELPNVLSVNYWIEPRQKMH